MAGQVKPIPVPVILAAMNGDENALAAVVAHYQKYIRALATRPVKDEYPGQHPSAADEVRERSKVNLPDPADRDGGRRYNEHRQVIFAIRLSRRKED